MVLKTYKVYLEQVNHDYEIVEAFNPEHAKNAIHNVHRQRIVSVEEVKKKS